MKRSAIWFSFLAVLIAFAAVFFLRQQNRSGEEQTVRVTEPPVSTAPTDEPGVLHPVPESPLTAVGDQRPLPLLDESDSEFPDLFAALFEREEFRKLVHLDNLIRRVVVTVDNLPRKNIPQKFLPVQPAGERFLAVENAEASTISPENAKRYTPYILLMEAVDTKTLVSGYVRLYPLFQEAYQDLGYPTGYFNDRLIEVIDHLLATPDVNGPVKLVRPKVVFVYADPELEKLSAGQKVLIRTGGENEARIKAKLLELRQELEELPAQM